MLLIDPFRLYIRFTYRGLGIFAYETRSKASAYSTRTEKGLYIICCKAFYNERRAIKSKGAKVNK